jgi:hypothetical protein
MRWWWCCGASSIEPAGPAPPLAATQLAKKREEAEVIAAQLAKPSYWDEVGARKPNASALKAALADTVLVDAAWLARLAKKRGVLPRCQDLPPGARVTLEEMEKWTEGWTVGVLVISYPWWAPPRSRPLHSACASPHPGRTHVAHPLLPRRTGSTPTTQTRTACSSARSRKC